MVRSLLFVSLALSASVALAASPSADEPPELRRRVESLEARMDRVERILIAPTTKLPTPPTAAVAPPQLRVAVGHTHTCARGHTWDHTMDGGAHICPFCGLPQNGVDPVPRMVSSGPADPDATVRYSLSQSPFSTGCSGPGCSTTGTTRVSSGKWYLGKSFGR